MNKKYKEFFKKTPNPTPMKAESFFNEDVKNTILHIKNSETLEWKEYEKIAEKYKDSYEVKIALLRNDDTPVFIRDSILENEIASPEPKKLVLFECLKGYISSVPKIDKAIYLIGDDIIENELR